MLDPSGVAEMSRQDLLWELLGVVAATVFLVTSGASIVLSFLRSRDRLLLWLGVFILFYGTRLMMLSRLVQAATGFAGPPAENVVWAISACIQFPGALFFRELLGIAWRKVTTTWLWIQATAAPIGIVIALGVPKYRGAFMDIDNVLAITSVLFLMGVIF